MFFDDETTLIVDDDPQAVREGVDEMIARGLDADRVREVTLAKLGDHRDRVIAEIQRIYREEGVARDAAETWSEIFFDQMCRHEQPHADVIARIEATRGPIHRAARRRSPVEAQR